MEDLHVLPVDVVEGFWKWDGDLRSAVDEVYDTSARLPGSNVGEIMVYVGLRSCWWPMGYSGRQSSCRKWQGLRCGAGVLSAWLGLPAIGWVAISKN